jgi:serine phosphatase RsbU (regulator of sigma subunit)
VDAQGSQIQPGKRLTSFFRKYALALFFLVAACADAAAAIPDSLIYRLSTEENSNNVHFNGIDFSFVLNDDNSDYWLFSPVDNYRFALRQFDDTKWKNLASDFEIDDDSAFTGIGWFRLHYKAAQVFSGTTLYLHISHNGASELFHDGSFLQSFGKVSADPALEIGRDPRNAYFALVVQDTLEHVLAVRYSNANYRKYADDFGDEDVGFRLRFFRAADKEEIVALSEYQRFFFIGISAFLFALALVHGMIYAFERTRRFNLYHSIFTLSLSLLFLFPVLNKLIESPLTTFRVYYFTNALPPTFFFSVIVLLFSLFQKKINKFFYICLGTYLAALVAEYIFGAGENFFTVSLFFMMYVGSIIISIKAIRNNFRGARIVGCGVLGVTLFMVLSILALIFVPQQGIIFAIFFAIMAVLSLPLSMSVYLAYDFAAANRTLRSQIVQIEDLSARALREEQEKKEILENRKRVLEEQVKERTAQIMQQKEVIEEKNKDITDSINYAKRIQDAILAAKEIKYKLFPDAFVLFKPKDIVSGDFYWFAGRGGRRLIAACDCTGHGVPGALMSMIGNNILNQLVNERGFVTPDEILENLHHEVRRTLKQDENSETKDGMDLALLSFTSETGFEYAGAQRPLWIIRKGELLETKGTKMSVGGQRLDENMRFAKHSVSGEKGDLVYIFSDGYADQFNREDKKLMTRKFKEILLGIQHLSMPEQEKYLDEFIESWKGDMEQTDDILVIGIRL